jgi:NAD(P)-dependent dehydrogenase (short-subunit alcohol dehydrogenase family)
VAEARRELGHDVIAVQSDASRIAEIDELATTIRETFGGMDALFISAGISHAGSVKDATEHAFDEVFDVNAKGAYFTLQRLAPPMRKGAGIVLATSVSNVKGMPSTSIYAASKAALRSITRTFARELIEQGVRVNAVSPGPIDTGILDRSMPAGAAEALKARMIANNPMGRFGSQRRSRGLWRSWPSTRRSPPGPNWPSTEVSLNCCDDPPATGAALAAASHATAGAARLSAARLAFAWARNSRAAARPFPDPCAPALSRGASRPAPQQGSS